MSAPAGAALNIPLVDLKANYMSIKAEIDRGIAEVRAGVGGELAGCHTSTAAMTVRGGAGSRSWRRATSWVGRRSSDSSATSRSTSACANASRSTRATTRCSSRSSCWASGRGTRCVWSAPVSAAGGGPRGGGADHHAGKHVRGNVPGDVQRGCHDRAGRLRARLVPAGRGAAGGGDHAAHEGDRARAPVRPVLRHGCDHGDCGPAWRDCRGGRRAGRGRAVQGSSPTPTPPPSCVACCVCVCTRERVQWSDETACVVRT